jgi:transglutaminase-like putative cysteine protease
MYDYRTIYRAQNKYELTVHQAVFQLLVLPSTESQQRLIDFHISTNVAHEWWTAQNAFGAQCIVLSTHQGLSEIEIEVTSNIQLAEVNPFNRVIVTPEDQWFKIEELRFRVEYSMYLTQTPLTVCRDNDGDYLPEINKSRPMVDFIVDLQKALYDELKYDSEATDTNTTAEIAWAERKGVCQDFAHIFIGWCRRLGIPARYASGYLSQGHQYRGDGQLHAWAECYLPLDGWVGVDASNNLLVDHHYIKIAHGRDYNDCSPMTGVLISGGKQVSLHSVSVDMQPNQ